MRKGDGNLPPAAPVGRPGQRAPVSSTSTNQRSRCPGPWGLYHTVQYVLRNVRRGTTILDRTTTGALRITGDGAIIVGTVYTGDTVYTGGRYTYTDGNGAL